MIGMGLSVGLPTAPAGGGGAAAFDPLTDPNSYALFDQTGYGAGATTLGVDITTWTAVFGAATPSYIAWNGEVKSKTVAGINAGEFAYECQYGKNTLVAGTNPGSVATFELWAITKWSGDGSSNGGWVYRGWDGGYSGVRWSGGFVQWYYGGTSRASYGGQTTSVWCVNRFQVKDAGGGNLAVRIWVDGGAPKAVGTWSAVGTNISMGIGDTDNSQDHKHTTQFLYRYTGNLTDGAADDMSAYLAAKYTGLPAQAAYSGS